jgi:hypothetical protein
MVLGKGAIKLGLEQHRVLLSFVQLLLQSFSSDDHVTVPLQELGLLTGPLHQALRRITAQSVLNIQ